MCPMIINAVTHNIVTVNMIVAGYLISPPPRLARLEIRRIPISKNIITYPQPKPQYTYWLINNALVLS